MSNIKQTFKPEGSSAAKYTKNGLYNESQNIFKLSFKSVRESIPEPPN